jgi:O-antigen/teichoic acid export membrane protein
MVFSLFIDIWFIGAVVLLALLFLVRWKRTKRLPNVDLQEVFKIIAAWLAFLAGIQLLIQTRTSLDKLMPIFGLYWISREPGPHLVS